MTTDAAPAQDEPRDHLRWLLWAPVILAFVMRVLWLGIKPPHFDEGVNGWFIDQMKNTGFYHYDPANYHGPFHFYVLFLAQTLFGRSVAVLRTPLILINTATVWLLMQFRRFIPFRACLLAAFAMAVSPGMMFYSRYAIHESWLVFGMVLALWGLAELWTRGRGRGVWAMAMGLTLMMLVKETFIIHVVAFILAAATLFVLERFIPSGGDFPGKPVPQQWKWSTLRDAVLLGFLLLYFFYSGGFLDRHGAVARFFEAFAAWARTGKEGHGHEKPPLYWLQLIGQYEWPAAIGLLYSLRALFPGMNRLSRYLAIYGCGTLVGYSIVSYKTPWCIISIIWPFLFLFGDAFHSFLSWAKATRRQPLALAFGVFTAVLLAANAGYSSWLNYWNPTDQVKESSKWKIYSAWLHLWHPADTHEPYVYVQTLNDLFKLTKPLKELAAHDPRAYHMRGNIILSSYHPLPWVLGDFPDVGYYDKQTMPSTMDAGFLVVEESHVKEVEAQLQERYFVEPFQLRDSMAGGKLYLNCDWFAPVFPGKKPDFEPHAPAPEPAAGPKAEPADSAAQQSESPEPFSPSPQ